jgi:SWI/SNF-related matrix-associated actin-dependent regulator 1 of chromatin subfamily A
MVRRLKSDVLKELPPKRRQLVVLDDAQIDWTKDPAFKRWRELYEKDYEARLAAIEAAHTQEEYRNAVRALDSFTGIAFQEMSEFRHKTALAKLPACMDYIDQILETGIDKLVIFAHHQDVLASLASHYGAGAVSLHGQIKRSDREAAVKRFQEGDARIFIGGLKAAGIGLNLHAASTVVFIEIDWNPAVLSQAEDRLCRIGQKKMVHVIHLIVEGTLDANICKRVVAKQEVIDKALNRLPEHGLVLPTTQTIHGR